MDKAEKVEGKLLSPTSRGDVSRKLPHITGQPGITQEKEKNSETNTGKSTNASGESGSVAYISETLIKQITKEENFDLITSLTIHFPKDKLNKKIKYIENLEKLKRLRTLNLSNNMIEKMQKLETLTELHELNLSHNCIKVIECVESMQKLEALNLSGNQIASIPRQTIKKIRTLKLLNLSNNKLESLLEVTKLRPLQDLTNLNLQDNPFNSLPHYRQFVIYQLRSLEILDNQKVTKEERREADTRFAQEEVQRLEVELAKQEKVHQALEDEKKKADKTIVELKNVQNALKEKEKLQAEKMKELEQDIEAKNTLVKAKNADLIKASEKQYRLEQELAFYKLDAKFELLGQLPLLDDEVDEQDGMDDSTYIGKATFKRNQFVRASHISGMAGQNAHVKSLRRNYEDLEKMGADLDRVLNEKEEALRQLQREIDEKNNQLRDVSEKLASLELSLAEQMATLGQGNELARKQLAEKIEFIKNLQAAAEELEARMKIVANDVIEKQRELEELGRERDNFGGSDDDPQFDQELRSKEAELRDAYDKLSQMKEELEMLNQRIAEEKAEVERLRKELEEEPPISHEAIEQLKNELEGVILALNKRLGELQNLAKEQQARIHDLEQEGDDLRAEIEEGKDTQESLEDMEQKLQYALVALNNEERKSQEAELKGDELKERLTAFEKNNKLGLMEADGKVKHANKEIAQLQDNIKKMKAQLEKEREAARARAERDQDRIAKALEAARGLGDKEKDIKELALQVNALKATNEALKDRLVEAEQELKRRARDADDKDKLLKRLKNLVNDLNEGHTDIRQPFDETDGVGECLADLHKKYLDLLNDLEDERQKRKHQQKQAKAAVDGLRAELSSTQSQLMAAENALAQLKDDSVRKGDEIKELEDEIGRLRKRLQEPSDKYQDEVDHVRDLAKRQKDRLENEIQELQDELQELQDKHFEELRDKDKAISELEAMLSHRAQNAANEDEKRKLRKDLDGLKRLLSERKKANEDIIEEERKKNRAQRKMDESRRRIEADLKNAENKILSVENLLKHKQLEDKKHDRHVDALAHEVGHLRKALDDRDRELSRPKKSDDVTPTHEIRHHIYTPRTHGDHEYHHYHDPSLPPQQNTRDSKTMQGFQRLPAVTPINEVHHHHYGDNAPMTTQSPAQMDVSAVPITEVINHHHYDNVVAQTPATSTVNQLHRHLHYGNGDFTMQLKTKRTKKKEYCNVSEHDYLEDDVVALEEKLASTNSKLSSQVTENKLNTLRSDLQNLQHTVCDSHRQSQRSPTKGVETHLDETLAKLQDHMLTLMDHRANLLSQHM
ncbi:centriolin-like [Dendronephthya gigantea]|uniref:centriolin-like n=1 Tax=Dendronephthya gigantea TaxID=151771 RepID=UPI00106DA7DA|nr:centriolin-like [Dendronephthya gigantea]